MALILQAPTQAPPHVTVSHRGLTAVFFGTPLFAVPALRMLREDGWNIRAVVTAPDKPTGRRMTMTPSAVRTVAEELGLEVYTPVTLRDGTFQATLEELKPDLCIVVAYGKLIPQSVLAIPRLGFVNIHPSLLPAYRGPSPIPSAILDGCASTGVSIMLLDADTDHGPVLTSVPWTIPSGFDTPLCEDALSRVGAKLLVDSLPGYMDGTLMPQPQDHSLATFTTKFVRSDGRLDWSQPAQNVVNKIRALSANPGTWTIWEGKTLNVLHAHTCDTPIQSAPPGTVILQGSELAVVCGTGALVLEVLQREGSTQQSARDFRNGHQGIVGSILV